MSENNDILERELYERIFVRLSDIKSIDQDVVKKMVDLLKRYQYEDNRKDAQANLLNIIKSIGLEEEE